MSDPQLPPPLPEPGAGGDADLDAASATPPDLPPQGPGPEQPPTLESLAMTHDTEASRTYPCEACGGELHYDIKLQMLRCSHCGATHDLREVEGAVQENDLREALALIRAGAVSHSAAFLPDEREIICQNCGGHTTFSGSLTATMCPYCATPIQRDDVHAAPQRLPVDGVLPFEVPEGRARELIEDWIDSRWFAPSEFKKYNRTGSFASVYAAYFTYDADTLTTYRGRRGDHYTVTVGSGDNRRTEVRTRWRRAAGQVHNMFDDVTVFANTGLDGSRIAKLEPWPTERSKPYSAEYVAGHLARTYDHDVEECLPEATSRMESEISFDVRRDIGGDVQEIHSMNIDWRTMTYKHLLLPIWLLTVIYEQRPFQVYINGVTGEVHGERPYSKVKIALAVGVALTILVTILVVYTASGGG
ncbi:MAG: hypothetical protein AAGF73_04730 [Actinomycetota bacterium]